MKIKQINENIVVVIEKKLLDSDIQEFADLKNQIAKCIHKTLSKEERYLTKLFIDNNDKDVKR